MGNETTHPQGSAPWWTPFRKGIAAGVLVTMLVVGVAWWVHRGVYACVAWGHAGELVSCRVH